MEGNNGTGLPHRRRNWYYTTKVGTGPWILRGNQAQGYVDTSRMWNLMVHGGTMTNYGPELFFVGLPKLGTSYEVHMRHGKPQSIMAWVWGTAQAYTPLNSPNNNCYLLCTTDLANVGMLVDTAGRAVRSFSLPNDPSLAGIGTFTQFIVFDGATSTWYSSNGGSMVFGW